jgi:hypothetical protein
MTGLTGHTWQYWVTLFSLVIQGISLVAIFRPVAKARKLLSIGANKSIDGGNSLGVSGVEDISDVVDFLLKQVASPYLAVIAIACSLALQLIVAIFPVTM